MFIQIQRFTALVLGLYCVLLHAQVPSNTPSNVQIHLTLCGATPSQGQILVSLFASEATYLKKPVQEAVLVVPAVGCALSSFSVAPGTYGLAAIYDENSNNKMDTGFLGIPKEKGGFSNNAKGRFGPAKWSAAKFEVADQPVAQTINLVSAK